MLEIPFTNKEEKEKKESCPLEKTHREILHCIMQLQNINSFHCSYLMVGKLVAEKSNHRGNLSSCFLKLMLFAMRKTEKACILTWSLFPAISKGHFLENGFVSSICACWINVLRVPECNSKKVIALDTGKGSSWTTTPSFKGSLC